MKDHRRANGIGKRAAITSHVGRDMAIELVVYDRTAQQERQYARRTIGAIAARTNGNVECRVTSRRTWGADRERGHAIGEESNSTPRGIACERAAGRSQAARVLVDDSRVGHRSCERCACDRISETKNK